jgi:hypothetical protein
MTEALVFGRHDGGADRTKGEYGLVEELGGGVADVGARSPYLVDLELARA